MPDSGEVAKIMVRHMSAVIDQPALKGQYWSSVIEAVTEYVRRHEFAALGSRENCVFACLTVEAARDFVHRYRQGTIPHAIYAVEPTGRAWVAELLTQGFDRSTLFDAALLELAEAGRSYWRTLGAELRAAGYQHPEVLLEGGARIVSRVE